MRVVQLVFLALCFLSLPQAHAGTILISEQEASLPPKPGAFDARGIIRGPRVELVQPGESTYSPMRFQIRFVASGGATIDPKTLRVTYLKTPEVDLTPRVRPFTQPAGIDIPDAEAPAGEHLIRVEITDSEGRSRSAVFSLKISR